MSNFALIATLESQVKHLTAELTARTEEKEALAAALAQLLQDYRETDTAMVQHGLSNRPDDLSVYGDPTAILVEHDAAVRAKARAEGIRKAADRFYRDVSAIQPIWIYTPEQVRDRILRMADAEEENQGRHHIDCPCWITGKYKRVEGCKQHPVDNPLTLPFHVTVADAEEAGAK